MTKYINIFFKIKLNYFNKALYKYSSKNIIYKDVRARKINRINASG